MSPIYFTMKKIWCETDLVLDKFEIGSGKRQKSSYWSKLELRWWNLVVKHFSSFSGMPWFLLRFASQYLLDHIMFPNTYRPYNVSYVSDNLAISNFRIFTAWQIFINISSSNSICLSCSMNILCWSKSWPDLNILHSLPKFLCISERKLNRKNIV